MESGNAQKIFEEPLKTEGGSRSRWPAIGISRLLLSKMQDSELLKYAIEHGMINVSYSEVFDEWNDRRLPICGDFLRLWEDFYEIYKIFNCK